ncbi:hypothetical protein [Halomarina pelagica]|uniref:hypothetical protein n=1 Tax=Halomarina pelagica TaxID=2961599 RepID=UPI0020C326C9|nr:hypothetical protein [Halomarina sp. BND7]
MNTLAKRIHNITPEPIRLHFEGGDAVVLAMRSAEFFQEAFQAEGVDRETDTTYRMITDGEDDPLLAARETESGWEVVGEVDAVEPA